jgi:outer membrane protein TolC
MGQLFVMAAALAALAGPAEEVALADALAALDDANLGVAQARSRAEEAAAVVSQARAALVPSVSAAASWVRNSDEVRIGLPPPLAVERLIQPEEAFGVAGTLRVPLVVPNAWYEVGAARAGARAAEATAEAARRRTRAAFAQAAYGARAAEEVVVASEQALESAAELVRSAERRVRAGTAAPLDRLKARTEQVRRESDLARARAELDRARLALGVLLGREAPVRILVPEAEGDAEASVTGGGSTGAPRTAGLAAEALGRRAEVAAQAAQVEAARAQIRASRARLAPQLQASASVFAQDVPFPTGEREGWRAAVELVWPLFDGGLREGRRREAEARLGTAHAAAEAQRLAVIHEVTDATRDLDVARERLRLAVSQRQLAADTAASARRSFEAGIASSLDVLDANDRLYLADVGLADGRARVAQARVALDYAAGREP